MLDTSKCLLTKHAIQRILYGIKPFFDSKIGVKYETRPLQTGRSAPSECQRAAAFAGGAGNRKNGGQCSVREFAAQNYTSPAAVIRLSKKMGYTGYTDMIYRIGFLIQNEIDNKNHASDITAFIGDIPEEKMHSFDEAAPRQPAKAHP